MMRLNALAACVLAVQGIAFPVSDIGDCLVSDREAKLGKFTFNSVVAPVMVILSLPDNQTFKLLIDSWSAAATFWAATFWIVGPLAFHQLTMPAKDSLRLENADDLTKLLYRAVAGEFSLVVTAASVRRSARDARTGLRSLRSAIPSC